MLRKTIFVSFLIGVALVLSPNFELSKVSGNTGGGGDELLIPHVFNLDPLNNSTLVIQNVGSSPTEVTVQYFRQDGVQEVSAQETIAPMGTAEVTPGVGFIGTASISSDQPILAIANWNLNVSSQSFKVGVPSVLFSQRGTSFAFPIGTVGPNSKVAVAMHNTVPISNLCVSEYNDLNGDVTATQTTTLVGSGQSAEFTDLPPAFRGSAVVSCTDPVVVTAVIQDQANGFPTTLTPCSF